jgi:chromate transporter
MMNETSLLHLNWADWFNFFLHYLSLSLLAVGGAISATPEMHRYLIGQQHWLTGAQFRESIAIAQAAPGPNILFVALIGWNVGINTGSTWAGLLGMTLAMVGMLLPSTLVTYFVARWGHQNRELRAVRAFKQGLAPIVIALIISTGWLLANANGSLTAAWPLWILTGLATVIAWRTKLHLFLVLGAGAFAGAFGLV